MTDAPTPGIGHNEPPDEFEPVIQRALDLVASCNRLFEAHPVVNDEEVARDLDDQIKLLRDNRTALEAQEKREREPFDLLAAAVHVKYRVPLRLVGIALVKAGEIATGYLQLKKSRLAAEAEARRQAAAEAQERAERLLDRASIQGTVESQYEAMAAAEEADDAARAAGRAPAKTHVRGDFSPRAMFLKTTWAAKATDESAALKAYGMNADVRAVALEKATKIESKRAQQAKGKGTPSDGFEWFKTEKAQ